MLIVVQCVPARLRQREALSAALRSQGVDVEFVEAKKEESPRQTFVRSLRAGRPPWVIYLQDDSWPAPDFAPRLADLLAKGAFNVLALYSDCRKVLDANAAGKPCVRLSPGELTMAVGLAVATELVEPFAAWLPLWESANPQHRAAFDLSLAAFCRRERLIIQAAVPSLVQHRDAESFLGHPCGRRKSRTFFTAYGEIPPC